MAYLGFVDIFQVEEPQETPTPPVGDPQLVEHELLQEPETPEAAQGSALFALLPAIQKPFSVDAVKERIRSRETLKRREKQRTATVTASAALTGAAAGSVLGPLGTIIGAGVGAAGGLIYHFTAGKKQAKKEKKIRQQLILTQQQEEQRLIELEKQAKAQNAQDIQNLTNKTRQVISTAGRLSSGLSATAAKLNQSDDYDKVFYDVYLALNEELKNLAAEADETLADARTRINDLEIDLAQTYDPVLQALLDELENIRQDIQQLVSSYKPLRTPMNTRTVLNGLFGQVWPSQITSRSLFTNSAFTDPNGLGSSGCGSDCPCEPCGQAFRSSGVSGLAGMGDLTNWLKDTRNNNRAALGLPPNTGSDFPWLPLIGVGAAYMLLKG